LSQIISLIASPFITFIFSNRIIDENPVSKVVKISLIFNLIGAWFRTGVNVNFAFIIIGNAISGLTGPFVIGPKNKLITTWFKQEKV